MLEFLGRLLSWFWKFLSPTHMLGYRFQEHCCFWLFRCISCVCGICAPPQLLPTPHPLFIARLQPGAQRPKHSGITGSCLRNEFMSPMLHTQVGLIVSSSAVVHSRPHCMNLNWIFPQTLPSWLKPDFWTHEHNSSTSMKTVFRSKGWGSPISSGFACAHSCYKCSAWSQADT